MCSNFLAEIPSPGAEERSRIPSPFMSMALGALEANGKNPSRIKPPLTWGDLQAMNSVIPGAFYEQRVTALADREHGSAFAALDSTLARAVWSRRDTDNPKEPLPPDLKTAAHDLLDLMHIRESDGLVDHARNLGNRVASGVSGLIASVRTRMGLTQHPAR